VNVPRGIFISYRRQDTGDFAGRLYDRLTHRFGQERVFIDVDTIEPGVDFAEAINQAVGTCEVLLAVIGPGWVTATGSDGHRRLDDPDDIVRLEVEAALERDVRVIPVLVGGAVMPQRGELPESLGRLARRNALSMRHESFNSDVARLITAIERIVGAGTPADPMPPVSPGVDPVAARHAPVSDLFLQDYSWDYGKAKPPAGDAHGRILDVGGDHLLVDPELDLLLGHEELPLRVEPEPFTVDAELRSYLPAAKEHRKGAVLFAGTCVRLGTDVTRALLEQPEQDRSVEVQRVAYFDLLCSNYLASYAVRSRNERGVRLHGIDLVLNQHNQVRPLTNSELANVIGVSTIAITRDRQLVTGIQTTANMSSGGLRAPAGSGSVDEGDLSGSTTLRELVVKAMERELSEEVNLHGVGVSSQITGYFRWLEKGAKPEFVGITALDTTAREVRLRPIRRSEEQLVAAVDTTELDLRDIRVVGDHLEGLPPELRYSTSVPLLLALHALASTLERDPELVDRLLQHARDNSRVAKQPSR
jgi:hypothetical protein